MDKNLDIPMVSVIVPTYNRAHLLGRALQSILKQTYKDFEVIVVDDGSTDNTMDVVRFFRALKINYIKHSENKGEPAARNTGVKAARGEYVAFLDSDDEWLPEKLEKEMDVFKKEPSRLGVVYSDMCEIERNGDRCIWKSPTFMPEDGLFYKRALKYHIYGIGIGSAVVKKECFGKAGLFDERLSYYVDLDFFIRLSKHYYFYHIREPLMNYHVTSDSFRWVTSAHIESEELILKKYFDDIKQDRKTLSTHYWRMGRFLCMHNDAKKSRPYLVKAIFAYPLNYKAIVFLILSIFGNRIFFAIKKKKRTSKKKKNFRLIGGLGRAPAIW